MIYIPSFIKTGSDIRKFMKRIHRYRATETHRQHGDFISLLIFFRHKESGIVKIPKNCVFLLL
jgi:hypothetical protein